MGKNVFFGLLGIGGLIAVVHSFFSGKPEKVEAIETVKEEKTPQQQALEERSKIMAEMGRKGGKASAKKRKEKKEKEVEKEHEEVN